MYVFLLGADSFLDYNINEELLLYLENPKPFLDTS